MRTSCDGCIRQVNRRTPALFRPAGAWVRAFLAIARSIGCGRALLLLAWLAAGHVSGAGVVTVSQPWLAPAGRHASTPLYLVLASSEPVTLVGARSPLGDVQLYDGARRVEAWPLLPGAPLAMTLHGVHLVVRDLARPLVRNARVPVTLSLRDADGVVRDVDVDAEVRLRSPIDDERRAHGMHPH